MKPLMIYCYDAYCGWCYGFSNVIHKISEQYKDKLSFEVLSGGMILPDSPVHISASAGYIAKAYKQVEETTGVKFGEHFLWHIFNPEESDWYPNSEKPAIALSILKEFYPDRAIEFAGAIQYALHQEGRDLTDDEAYRHLLEKYGINSTFFYEKLHSEEYKNQAHYEFSLVKQLQISGYPSVLIQIGESKFHLVARGYTKEEDLKNRIDLVLADLEKNQL